MSDLLLEKGTTIVIVDQLPCVHALFYQHSIRQSTAAALLCALALPAAASEALDEFMR